MTSLTSLSGLKTRYSIQFQIQLYLHSIQFTATVTWRRLLPLQSCYSSIPMTVAHFSQICSSQENREWTGCLANLVEWLIPTRAKKEGLQRDKHTVTYTRRKGTSVIFHAWIVAYHKATECIYLFIITAALDMPSHINLLPVYPSSYTCSVIKYKR